MESGQRGPRKGRRLGSSRRRQMQEPADGQDAPMAPEPESLSSPVAAELQCFFQDCGAKERGFVTREDLAAAKFSFLGGEEELELIFDWLDVEQKGRLSLEEFSSGLKNVFGSSLSTHRLHRKRPLSSKRDSAATSFPVPEEADPEEKEAFFAFVQQLGAGHSLPEQEEIWQLWVKLRREEPQLAGSLEGFLATMSSRLQEVRADREVLELTLRKRDSEHHQESDSRGLAFSSQMQEVLAAKEREFQRLTEGQRELEAQLHGLRSSHRAAGSENQQLRGTEQELAGQLEEARGQLRVTRGRLSAARGHASWQVEEEPSVPRAGDEKAPDAQAVSSEEAPLPGLFGEEDDWDQLLSNFNTSSRRALQLSWSPPPTPRTPSGPQTPRVVRQISISEPHAWLLGQEPPSDLDGAPRSPSGAPSRAKEGKGVGPDGQDSGPEPPVQPRSLEPKEESGPGPEALSHGSFPGAPTGESGSLVAAALKMLVPLEDAPPPQLTAPPPQAPAGPSEQLQASHPDDKNLGPGPVPEKAPRQSKALHQDLQVPGSEIELGSPGARALTPGLAGPSQDLEPVGQPPTDEARGPEAGHSEPPQRAQAEAPAPRTRLPPLDSPQEGAEPGGGAGPQEHTQSPRTLVELEAQPLASPTTAPAEEQGSLPSREPPAENRPPDPGTDSGGAAPTSSPGSPTASEPPADPDYLFHVIFLGDSNVGKTSFLHLLHQNSFATGLTATVGVDFRVKTLLVDHKCFALQLWDTAGQERYHSMTRQLLRKADGVVLMYDVTSWESFAHVRYWLDCLRESGPDGVVILLLGNKKDCEEERQVPTEVGQQLAQELGVSFGECSAALGHNILEPVVNLARSLKMQEDRLKGALVEMTPKRPQKRAGCCF
uniref:RAB44, member RAS oncogene family n=1 Tax=Ursus maritimus TaxID=29073 RepID=A0A452TYP6_URSMA